jgi:hypothetical protein
MEQDYGIEKQCALAWLPLSAFCWLVWGVGYLISNFLIEPNKVKNQKN